MKVKSSFTLAMFVISFGFVTGKSKTNCTAYPDGFVQSLIVWNSKDRKVGEYKYPNKLCQKKFNLEAKLECENKTQSVKFFAFHKTNTNRTITTVDNAKKYFMFNDNKPRFDRVIGGKFPSSGVYNLTVTPYTSDNATGTAGGKYNTLVKIANC